MEWYDWRNVRERLLIFGRAVQGVTPYRVKLEMDPNECPTASCSYTKRLITANPTIFPDTKLASTRYNLVRAMLVHEAGHRRFTTPLEAEPMLHNVTNILEDQRIEYLMWDNFYGLHSLIHLLSSTMYDKCSMLLSNDDPGQVIGAILQARWTAQLGKPLKGDLSKKNQALFEQALPMAQEAWSASDTQTVQALAQKIIDLLNLKEIPEWVRKITESLGTESGEREEGDGAEKGSGSSLPDPEDKATDPSEKEEEEIKIEDALPSSTVAGTTMFPITSYPYISIVERVEPQAQELADELRLAWREGGAENAARGQRLSIRELIRTPDEPFLTETEVKNVPRMTFRVLIDHSTSMNLGGGGSQTRMECAVDGAMMLHLFGTMMDIEHEIIIFPHNVRVADLHSGESGLALIAGMNPALTWWEDLGKTLEIHAKELLDRPEELKLILAIHDGYPNDADVARDACQTYKGTVEIIGVGIDLDAECAKQMGLIFPENRLLLCQKAEDLPRKLAAVIRSIYGL